jgi:uncharacterized membrane protein YadS
MRKITKHDVKVFLLGMLAMLLISLIYNWDEFTRGFQDGFNGKPLNEIKTSK